MKQIACVCVAALLPGLGPVAILARTGFFAALADGDDSRASTILDQWGLAVVAVWAVCALIVVAFAFVPMGLDYKLLARHETDLLVFRVRFVSGVTQGRQGLTVTQQRWALVIRDELVACIPRGRGFVTSIELPRDPGFSIEVHGDRVSLVGAGSLLEFELMARPYFAPIRAGRRELNELIARLRS